MSPPFCPIPQKGGNPPAHTRRKKAQLQKFPAGFDQGYCLHGFGRESLKLSGLKLRKIVLANGASYWLRPSFIFSYMTGTADELAYPLLLAAHGVPFWLLTLGFGHNDMFWYRLGNPVSVHHSGKSGVSSSFWESGVSSSFLSEKMN